MSDIFRSVVKVGVLALNVGEGVMPDDMLVNPRIWSAEHEADVHA